jgi:hypothetical protein
MASGEVDEEGREGEEGDAQQEGGSGFGDGWEHWYAQTGMEGGGDGEQQERDG